MAESESVTNRIRTLFVHPMLNGWGFIIGVLGFVFSIYTYWDTQSVPLLTAQVFPNRTVLVSPEGTEDLQVFANGKPVKGPITSAQIAIWNKGKHPIQPSEILSPLHIRIENGVPILSAKVQRSTRDLIDFKVDDSNAAEGDLAVTFRVLEDGDGALLQVTYAGDDKAVFIGTGAIMGQPAFQVTSPTLNAPGKQPSNSGRWPRWARVSLGIVLLLLAVLYSMTMLPQSLSQMARAYSRFAEDIRERRPILPSMAALTVFALVNGTMTLLAYAIFLGGAWATFQPDPPFPFQ